MGGRRRGATTAFAGLVGLGMAVVLLASAGSVSLSALVGSDDAAEVPERQTAVVVRDSSVEGLVVEMHGGGTVRRLDGAELSGAVNIAYRGGRTARAEFSLDGLVLAQEALAPFDLLGSVEGESVALDTTTLAEGRHTVQVQVRQDDGSSRDVQATFTVVDGADRDGFGHFVVSDGDDRDGARLLRGEPLAPGATLEWRATNAVDEITFRVDGSRPRAERTAPFDAGEAGSEALQPSEGAAATVVTAVIRAGTGRRVVAAVLQPAVPRSEHDLDHTSPASPVPTDLQAHLPEDGTDVSDPPPGAAAASAPSSASDSFDPLTFDWSSIGAQEGVDRPDYDGSPLEQDGAVIGPFTTGAERLEVSAVDTGFRQSLIRGALKPGEGDRAVLIDSTVDSQVGSGVSGGSVTMSRSRVTSLTNDGINPVGSSATLPSLIEYSVIERQGSRYKDAHQDGVQMWSGSHVTIRRSRITGWSTSAVLLKPDRGPVSHVLIEETYLSNTQGFYCLYIRESNFGRPTMVTVRGNVFGDGEAVSAEPDTVFVRDEATRASAIRRGVSDAASWVVWSGNTDELGREVPPPNGWHT